MLTPDKVTYTSPTIDTSEVEAGFDKAIERASFSCKWPAVVRSQRDGVTLEQIRATILKYRTAGWRVVEGTGDTRATIWHPDCPESQDEGGRQGYRA